MASGSEPPAKRLRTGGRLHEEAQPRVRSRLAEKLLESWAWGEKSPQEVQQLAAASCRDWADSQVKPPAKLQALAKLGSSGLHANKMYREILAIASEGCLFPLPSQHRVGATTAFHAAATHGLCRLISSISPSESGKIPIGMSWG